MRQSNITAAPLVACCLLAAVLPPAYAQEDVSAREGDVRSIKAALRVSYQSYYTGEIEAVIEAAAEASSLQAGIPAGWKSMGNGVPSEAVINAYNDYIKKLPATERPGVADVRYYQDEKGQEGVAITIFVSGVTSIHFLSYDTAGKRLDVKQMKVDGDVK